MNDKARSSFRARQRGYTSGVVKPKPTVPVFTDKCEEILPSNTPKPSPSSEG